MAVRESLGNYTILVRRARVHAGTVAVDAKAEARVLNRVLLIALGLGGCVDIFFYNKDTGISVLVFVTMVVAALVAMALTERIRVVMAQQLAGSSAVLLRGNGGSAHQHRANAGQYQRDRLFAAALYLLLHRKSRGEPGSAGLSIYGGPHAEGGYMAAHAHCCQDT